MRILLVDDHILLLDALARVFKTEPDLEIVAMASDADVAISLAQEARPDIIMMDIRMAGMASVDAVPQLRELVPGVRIALFSAYIHDGYIQDALVQQVDGFISKREGIVNVIDALRRIDRGERYLSPDVQERIVETAGVPRARITRLTEREIEVIDLLTRGLSKREIGEVLSISKKTVDGHLERVMKKLNIHDRVDLTRYAVREGLTQS